MKNWMWSVIFVFAGFVGSSSAAVGDGLTLQRLCRAEGRIDASHDAGELADALQCQAYVEGVLTAYTLLSGALHLTEKRVETLCVPGEVKLEQVILVIQKYLKDHPEALHRGAGELTVTALRDAFPCR